MSVDLNEYIKSVKKMNNSFIPVDWRGAVAPDAHTVDLSSILFRLVVAS